MGVNTLNDRSSGQTITASFFNDIHQAMNTDFVGRNSSGVPTASQNLGTAAFPWGTIRAEAIIIDGTALDTSGVASQAYNVVSGKVRTTSNQPAFLTPNGAALSATIDATPTALQVTIAGVSYSVAADIALSSLTAAPSSNNTCLVNDTDAAGQDDTKHWGEAGHRKSITIDTVGSEISALIGKWAAFKISTEVFLGFVESATTISNCYRGFFYDSTLAPLNRVVFSNNDTITLMKLGYVFVDSDGTTAEVSYTQPKWNGAAPTSPITGDYWYDSANSTMKRYDGASFVAADKVFVGMLVNTSAACIAARCQYFNATFSSLNSVEVRVESNSVVRGIGTKQSLSVMGKLHHFNESTILWDMAANLATSADMYSATEQASTYYYGYIADTGASVISDIRPHWRPDLQGLYHPHNPWRCVASWYNNGSSNVSKASSYFRPVSWHRLRTPNGHGSSATAIRKYTTVQQDTGTHVEITQSSTNGDSMTILEPGYYVMSANDLKTSGSAVCGLTYNQTTLTQQVTATPLDETLTYGHVGNNVAVAMEHTIAKYLKRGDVIRWNTSGADDTIDQEHFQVERISGELTF